MEKEYIERLFDKKLDFYLKTVGAIQIVGPKWCGKSRTAKRHAKTVIDLMKKRERDQYIELAKKAPEVLLNSGDKPILIDEWQVISFIWNSIKESIDENGGFGQYILTGSVTDNTASKSLAGEENERHTGTGRIIRKVMRTMSSFESHDSNGIVSISNLKDNVFTPGISQKTIFDYSYLICRGGWPLAIDDDRDIALQQAKTFFDGLVNEDLFSLKDIPLKKDVKRAMKLLKSYSRNISTEASNESIKADLKENGDEIDKNTFVKYLLALERLYVIDELEAWNPNLRSKTAIREKSTRHFVDPSIATSALGITPESMFSDMKTFGRLFESLAIRDLRIYCDSIGAEVYHYRDKADREADAVISFADGSWALLEVKLGDKEEIETASKKLVLLAKDINKKEHPEPAFLMIVTAQKVAYKDDNGVYVVPLCCLKP
ncbi:MAG: DUF4143 domain-containing protein [Bacilli bacterium]|nr:DUF4143 domain-containing protein [Bacilli bacterium]